MNSLTPSLTPLSDRPDEIQASVKLTLEEHFQGGFSLAWFCGWICAEQGISAYRPPEYSTSEQDEFLQGHKANLAALHAAISVEKINTDNLPT